jgi:uncharacterized protein YjeT (DUF2065 family)
MEGSLARAFVMVIEGFLCLICPMFDSAWAASIKQNRKLSATQHAKKPATTLQRSLNLTTFLVGP